MKSKRIITVGSLCLMLILVALSAVMACTPKGAAPPPEAKTLKIGAIWTLSGYGSEAEILMKEGAEMCRDWINEKGGITIKGEKYLIELIIEDSKASNDGAVAAAIKLVEQDQVKFILGQVHPMQIIAAGSVTEPAKVLRSLTWGGGVPGTLGSDVPYTFRVVPCGLEVTPITYDYLVENYPNVKTVSIINPDDPGGQAFTAVSEIMAQAHGLTVVAKEFYPDYEQQDFYPVLTKVLAAKPDAIDSGTGFPLPTTLKLKQARELGFTGPMFNQSPVRLDTILSIVGKEFGTNYFNVSLDVNMPNCPPMIKELQKRWEAKSTAPFEFERFQGWDALWCLTQAIEKAQSLDTTEVKTAWENMTTIEATFGTSHMGGLKTYGANNLVVTPVPVSRLMNGKVESTKWYMPDIP